MCLIINYFVNRIGIKKDFSAYMRTKEARLPLQKYFGIITGFGVLTYILFFEYTNTLGHSFFGHVHYPTFQNQSFSIISNNVERNAYRERLMNANKIGMFGELRKTVELSDI